MVPEVVPVELEVELFVLDESLELLPEFVLELPEPLVPEPLESVELEPELVLELPEPLVPEPLLLPEFVLLDPLVVPLVLVPDFVLELPVLLVPDPVVEPVELELLLLELPVESVLFVVELPSVVEFVVLESFDLVESWLVVASASGFCSSVVGCWVVVDVEIIGSVLVPMPDPCVAKVMMPAVINTTTKATITVMMMPRRLARLELRLAAASRTSSGAMGVPVSASPVASSVSE